MTVHPKNWLQAGASTKKEWYINYRFHHPGYKEKYPSGYQVSLRGMNRAIGIAERRNITRALIDNEIALLRDGYNPINKQILPTVVSSFEIAHSTPFIAALEKARDMLPAGVTKNEIRKALVHISMAVRDLGYATMRISEVRRPHIKAVLETVGILKKNGKPEGWQWGAPSFNHYRSYLIMLFYQLNDAEATDVDPVTKIKKKMAVKRIREILTDAQFAHISGQLRVNSYHFWRFIEIFFRSGGRGAEMMRIRREDVDLPGQRFKVTVRKGKQWVEVWKTINDLSLPLWEEVMSEAGPGTYLFSHGLKPQAMQMNYVQVTKRWRLLVKKAFGITADFYSLKHKYTTETISRVMKKIDTASAVAAEQNSHKTVGMVKNIYDVNRAAREHDELKRVKNSTS